MANWESEIREAILRHGQFSTACLEQDPVKRNRDNVVKNWKKNNKDKVSKAVKKMEREEPRQAKRLPEEVGIEKSQSRLLEELQQVTPREEKGME